MNCPNQNAKVQNGARSTRKPTHSTSDCWRQQCDQVPLDYPSHPILSIQPWSSRASHLVNRPVVPSKLGTPIDLFDVFSARGSFDLGSRNLGDASLYEPSFEPIFVGLAA